MNTRDQILNIVDTNKTMRHNKLLHRQLPKETNSIIPNLIKEEAIIRAAENFKQEKATQRHINKLRTKQQSTVNNLTKLISEESRLKKKVEEGKQITPKDKDQYVKLLLNVNPNTNELSDFDKNIINDVIIDNPGQIGITLRKYIDQSKPPVNTRITVPHTSLPVNIPAQPKSPSSVSSLSSSLMSYPSRYIPSPSSLSSSSSSLMSLPSQIYADNDSEVYSDAFAQDPNYPDPFAVPVIEQLANIQPYDPFQDVFNPRFEKYYQESNVTKPIPNQYPDLDAIRDTLNNPIYEIRDPNNPQVEQQYIEKQENEINNLLESLRQQEKKEYLTKEELAQLGPTIDKNLQEEQKLLKEYVDKKVRLNKNYIPSVVPLTNKKFPANIGTNKRAQQAYAKIAKHIGIPKQSFAMDPVKRLMASDFDQVARSIDWTEDLIQHNYQDDIYNPVIKIWLTRTPADERDIVLTAAKSMYNAEKKKNAKLARQRRKGRGGYFINEGYEPVISPLVHLMDTNPKTHKLVKEYKQIEALLPSLDTMNYMKSAQHLERLRREIEKDYYEIYGDDNTFTFDQGIIKPGYVDGTFNVGEYIYGVPGGNTRYNYPYIYRNWGASNWNSTMEPPIRLGSIFDTETLVQPIEHEVGDARYHPYARCYAYVGDSIYEKPENPEDYYEYAINNGEYSDEESDMSDEYEFVPDYEETYDEPVLIYNPDGSIEYERTRHQTYIDKYDH